MFDIFLIRVLCFRFAFVYRLLLSSFWSAFCCTFLHIVSVVKFHSLRAFPLRSVFCLLTFHISSIIYQSRFFFRLVCPSDFHSL